MRIVEAGENNSGAICFFALALESALFRAFNRHTLAIHAGKSGWTLPGHAVLGKAPAVGTFVTRPTFHIHAAITLTNTVDTYLPLAGTTCIRAIGGIAIPRSAAFPLGTINVDAVLLDAFVPNANFTVAGTGLRVAVDRVAMPARAALSFRTFDSDATRLLTFLFDADLTLPRAIPPIAILRVALFLEADFTLGTIHVGAGQPKALPIHALQAPRAIRVVNAIFA